VIRVWDLRTGRQLKQLQGATQHQYRIRCCFSMSEEYVLSSDERLNHVLVFDVKSGEVVQRLIGHKGVVSCVASSLTEPLILTAG